MKLEYFRRRGFPDIVITEVEERFKYAYHRYKGVYDNKQSRGASHTSDSGVRTRPQSSSEEATVSLTLLSDDESSVAQVNEVELYLSTKRDGRYKSVIEFYQTKKGTYPVLFGKAKDYLAIPAMSASSESLFSRMNDVLTKKRNRISPEMVKMLAFLKYRLSGSNETPSSSDGKGEPDETDEPDESDEPDELDERDERDERDEEMGGEMDGDSCDAARTSKGKIPAVVEIVI